MSRPASRRAPARLWVGPLVLVAFALGVWVGRGLDPDRSEHPLPRPPDEAPAAGPTEPSPRATHPAQRPVISEPRPAAGPQPGQGKRIALVIDDLGRSRDDLTALAALGVPLSYAVLPFEPLTAEVTAELHRRDAEVLCHLPMEASDGADAGPGALTRVMTPEQLAAATRAALNAVPGATGANNHMGSELSGDRQAMRAILGTLAGEGLFWIDSRTRADSVGYRLALEMGIPAAERQVFLDGEPGAAETRRQFARLLEVAGERGAAVAIAHPHPTTLAVLREAVAEAVAAGYEFVPVSFLLDRTDVAPQ